MNLKRIFVYQSLVTCVLLLGMNAALWAQGATATVTGRVSDATGAILSGSNVTITNTATSVQYKTVTNNAGDYNVPLLPPGTYRVDIEAKGFKSEAQTGLTLQVGQTVALNYKLELGEVSQTVQVEATAVQLQTQTAETGVVVPNTQIIELPLNGRQYYSLTYLTPGTYPPAQNSTLSFRGGFNVAGSSEVENNFRVDGFNNNDPATNQPTFQPSIDDIQEFNLLTGIYSAQYGVYSGGQVLVVSKSGTNGIHGAAFEYIRNQVLDAKNFFIGPTAEPSYVRNVFGGAVGGPIIKNKFFLFVSYEGLRLHQDISALATVPTPAMVQGDFSAFLPANGGVDAVQLVNPLTLAPIAGNIITAANGLNTIGAALAAFYPKPTFPTVPGTLPSNNYNFNENRIENMNEIAVRGDYTINSSNSVYATFGRQNDPSFEPSNPVCGQSVIPGFGCNVGARGFLTGVSYTHIFNPALVNQVLLSWNQFGQPRTQQEVGINFVGQYNIPGVFNGTAPFNTGVPNTVVAGFASLAVASGEPQRREDSSYQATDSITYTHGRHTMTMGAQGNRFLYSLYLTENGRGVFNFNGSAGQPTSGNTFADLLFGTPDSTLRDPDPLFNHPRQWFWNVYAEDNWKVTSTLTLNLGLRYEYMGPIYEAASLYSNFDPTGAGILQVEGATTDGYPERLYNTGKHNFAPRIGFSWQLPHSTKTLLRGGFGYFYDNVTAGNGFLGMGFNPPFTEPEDFIASTANPIVLSNPYPNTIDGATSVQPFGVAENFDIPTVTEWSLGLQHQFTSTLVADVTYFGTKGTHLPLGYNNNQPLPSATNSIEQQTAARPFPNFGNTDFVVSSGNSSYHSLQVKLVQTLSHGLLFLASYTWGHSIDDGPGIATGSSAGGGLAQNFRDIAAERGNSDFNIAQHFTFSPVYELPFGKGRTWLQSGIPNAIAGGWQVTGIYTIQTGPPFTVTYFGDNSNTQNFQDRPNQIGNPNNGPKTVNEWFNIAAFATPPFGSFGDARRNSVTGPGFDNLDFALSRFFPVVPNRVKAEFRAELFNILNHPNFGLPNPNPDGPAFGAITTTGSAGSNNSRQIEFALRLTF
jgi:hypothetical protein